MSLSETVTLEKSLKELYAREKAYKEACDQYAEKKHAYDMKYAQEYLKAEGTIQDKKAVALVACEQEHEEYLKAQASKTFLYQKLKDAQGASSARQSILSASSRADQSYANDKRVT